MALSLIIYKSQNYCSHSRLLKRLKKPRRKQKHIHLAVPFLCPFDGADPVIMEHALLGLGGGILLHIFQLHNFFLVRERNQQSTRRYGFKVLLCR